MKPIKIAGACAVIAAAGGAVLASASYADVLLAKEMAVLTNQRISPARARQALDVQSKVAQADLPSKLQAAMGADYGGMWFENAAAQLHIGVTSPESRRTAEEVVARAGLAGDVALRPVRSTMAQLLATQNQWNRKLADLFAREDVATGIEPQRNALFVTLSSSVPASERAALKREASAANVNVLVEVAPSSHVGLTPDAKECNNFVKENAYCNPSITAGVEIWSKIKCKKVANQVGERFFKTQKECEEKKVEKGKEGEWEREKKAGENPVECTAGPAAIPMANRAERVLLTAGHCIEGGGGNNIEWFAFKRNLEEPLIGKAIEFKNGGAVGAKIGDYGDIKIEPGGGWQTGNANNPVLAVTAEWGRAEETRYRVKGERTPVAKAMNCHEGATSGEKCGEITLLPVSITVAGKTKEGLVEDTAERAGGDSGGPWLFVATEGNPNHEALMEGTHVGFKGANAVYEPFKKVEAGAAEGSLENMKLELLTTANEAFPRWYICAKPGGSTWLYEDSLCTKDSTGKTGAWELKTLAEGAGGLLEVTSKGTKTFTLRSKASGVKIEIKCTTEKDSGWIENPAGGGVGIDLVKTELTGCTVPLPAGQNCKVSEPIKINAKTELQTLEGAIWDVFTPDPAGGPLAKLILESCKSTVLNGEYAVEGKTAGLVHNATSTLSFSNTMDELTFAGEAAEFEGESLTLTDGGGGIQAL